MLPLVTTVETWVVAGTVDVMRLAEAEAVVVAIAVLGVGVKTIVLVQGSVTVTTEPLTSVV